MRRRSPAGTIDTPRWRDRIAAPFRNGLTVPSIERSPSGNSTSTRPRRSPACASLHRPHQIRVGIDRDDVRHPRDPLHEGRLEPLARPDEEELLEHVERQRRYDEERVDVTLVVRA